MTQFRETNLIVGHWQLGVADNSCLSGNNLCSPAKVAQLPRMHGKMYVHTWHKEQGEQVKTRNRYDRVWREISDFLLPTSSQTAEPTASVI